MDRFDILLADTIELITDFHQLMEFAQKWGILDTEVVRTRLSHLQQQQYGEDFIEDQLDTLMEALDEAEVQESIEAYLFDEMGPENQVGGIGNNERPTSPQAGPSGIDRDHSRQDVRSPQTGPSRSTPDDPYIIKKTSERTYNRNAAREENFRVRFRNDDVNQGRQLVNIHHQVHEMVFRVLDEARQPEVADNDMVKVVIHHQELDNNIVVGLRPWEEMNADVVLQTIEKVLNSHQNLMLDESFYITVGSIILPKGGAGGHLRITQLDGKDNSIHRKRSMVEIINYDHLCLSRSIAVAFCHSRKISSEEWRALVGDNPQKKSTLELVLQYRRVPQWFYINMIHKNRKEQKYLAMALSRLARISTDRPASIVDIEAFEKVLGVRILVVSSTLGNRFIRVGDDTNKEQLFLYHVKDRGQEHFHTICSIQGFYGQSYFCNTCFKPYSHTGKHQCTTTCIVCKFDKCPETDGAMSCRWCHMTCRSIACFHRHLKETLDKKTKVSTSQCLRWWKCKVCKKVVDRKQRDLEKIPHQCGEWFCDSCENLVMGEHLCYLRTSTPEERDPKFIMFDFECRQDSRVECSEGYSPPNPCLECTAESRCKTCDRCSNCSESWCGKLQHVPNYVVAHTCCEDCLEDDVESDSKCFTCGTRCRICSVKEGKSKTYVRIPCKETCGFRQVIFEGDATVTDFCRWLFATQHKGYTVIAHNMKGYDAIFLLAYLIDNSIRPRTIIFNGSKIMYMYVENGLSMRLVDSLNFLPAALSKLPGMFGLQELKKGYFPHFFNTKENQNYVGPYPLPSYYGADTMSAKDRKTFLKWHEEKRDAVFDFKKEMREYCISDVDILRQACLQFRDLLLKITKDTIDPLQGVTIAGVCMSIFKSMFLQEEFLVTFVDEEGKEIPDRLCAICKGGTLAVLDEGRWSSLDELKTKYGMSIAKTTFLRSPIAKVPSEGYVRKDQFSRVSIQWMEWLMHKTPGQSIRHALNGGEMSVSGTKYRLDGYCQTTKTAFEFHGCLYHGCSTCYTTDRVSMKHPRTKQSMEELYTLTKKKERHLKNLGYKYICIWEHEFTEMRKTDPELQRFLQTLDIQDRLEPRDAFFGGRTNAARLHYTVSEGEEVRYVDFTSLYPYVNKYAKYPVGHPTIVTDNFGPLSSYFGIAKVKILPPRGLYHPVLPFRSNGKLKFPLCSTCADTEQQTPCRHKVEQRVLLGTWCTPEVTKAQELGYEVLKIYEVYHFEETTQYDPEKKEGGLFSQYINSFLKYKQQASDWPAWCINECDRASYLQAYHDKEGVTLDEEDIAKNPGLRSLAKLCLNSFWGKFGQRLNMRQHAYFHEEEVDKFFSTLSDPSKQMEDFHILTDDTIQLVWTQQNEFIPDSDRTNIFLAAFTTCWARLKLYGVLERLQDRVLYFDTDSVIYVSRHGCYDPPLGDYLGELTDELGTGEHIIEYVSGGPKNYTYTTNKGKQTCKVRGFCLNFENSKLINFDAMKNLVLSKKRQRGGNDSSEEEEPPAKIIRTINPSKITRAKQSRLLYNRQESKDYRIVYTKRVIQPDLNTLPYGY